MRLSKLMMACAMCVVALAGSAQTKVIAHRGYWKCEGSAQNSIASLTKEIGRASCRERVLISVGAG